MEISFIKTMLLIIKNQNSKLSGRKRSNISDHNADKSWSRLKSVSYSDRTLTNY